ncbi:helix-turn-helix transcriptional regulator [Actinomadura viridis]|uniref:AraC-like DNA-binding protein n=1 Tax=Actinomadura viridis TaxID=58110 RepID=A0A931DEK6_9ACTN|nr:AraC family transcriptional regulator [Actinomadura viridis]MBG6086131.1 AraC-like DNA-binding protein [Actinomadura viridis]
MRSARVLIDGPDLVVREVTCHDRHTGWSEPQETGAVQVVLARRGRFRLDASHRSGRAGTLTIDPTTGYLHGPGAVQRFAHPAGGDVCTSITFVGGALTGEPWLEDAVRAPSSHEVRVDARLELAHRLLLRQGADPSGAVETVLDLLALALRGGPAGAPPAPGRAGLARLAREAILAGVPESGGLVSLARLLGTSPSHLSRTFRHHTGMPVGRYRNRARVSRALARIEEGETDLAALAAGLGFSDQAHLTRVMRAELGRTPGQVVALLTARPGRPARHEPPARRVRRA